MSFVPLRIEGLPLDSTVASVKAQFAQDEREFVTVRSLAPAVDSESYCTATVDYRIDKPIHPDRPIDIDLDKLLDSEHYLDIDDTFVGFTPLNRPTKPILADVIAFAGPDVHPINCWTRLENSGAKTKPYMWLRDRLPRDREDIRIMTFGFDAEDNILDCVERAKERLRTLPAEVTSSGSPRPLIFIAHGIGGLILEKSLVKLYRRGDLGSMGNVVSIMFFATPQRGIKAALESQLNWQGVSAIRENSLFIKQLRTDFEPWATYLTFTSCYQQGGDESPLVAPFETAVLHDRMEVRNEEKIRIRESYESMPQLRSGSTGLYPFVKAFLIKSLSARKRCISAISLPDPATQSRSLVTPPQSPQKERLGLRTIGEEESQFTVIDGTAMAMPLSSPLTEEPQSPKHASPLAPLDRIGQAVSAESRTTVKQRGVQSADEGSTFRNEYRYDAGQRSQNGTASSANTSTKRAGIAQTTRKFAEYSEKEVVPGVTAIKLPHPGQEVVLPLRSPRHEEFHPDSTNSRRDSLTNKSLEFDFDPLATPRKLSLSEDTSTPTEQSKNKVRLFGLLGARSDDEVDEFIALASAGALSKMRVIKIQNEDKGINWESCGSGQRNALHEAAANGHSEIVYQLLEMGFKKETRDKKGLRAMHLAAENGHLEVVKVLLERKAHVDPLGPSEETPLFLAAANGHEDIISALKFKNANVNAARLGGTLPLKAAMRGGHKDAVTVLKGYNALERKPDKALRGGVVVTAVK